MHTGENPYTCSVVSCGKRFAVVDDIRRHLRIHTGEKPHQYMHCNQVFENNTDLKTHMVIHTTENYSSCAMCVKGFSQTTDLVQHLQTHVIVPPSKQILMDANQNAPSDRHMVKDKGWNQSKQCDIVATY